jgi:methionine salvage enolase-phosphatase E1
MNNSLLQLEVQEVDISPQLRERERELLGIIEAFRKVSASEYWKVLRIKVFDGVVGSLHKKLIAEKNPTEMYRLQGQIVWAEKYADLEKMAQAYENELKSVRKKLHAN